MFDFLTRLFAGGPRPPARRNVVPAGTRDAVEFRWGEPSNEGEPAGDDLEALLQALRAVGWAPEVEPLGYAVEITTARGDALLQLGVGHNGEGPWVGFVEVLATDDVDEASTWVVQVHDALVAAGATDLRWYERADHDRGEVGAPWPTPSGPG